MGNCSLVNLTGSRLVFQRMVVEDIVCYLQPTPTACEIWGLWLAKAKYDRPTDRDLP